MKAKYQSVLKIMQLHIDRLELAIDKLRDFFPTTSDGVYNLDNETMLYLELMISRFAKLQDYMGSTVFDCCIEALGDTTDAKSIIDKVNILVKADLIDSEELWLKLREVRNFVTHEYPDRPDLIGKHLNQMHELLPALLTNANRLNSCLNR